MPHISISMYQGKTPEEKQILAEKIHKAVLNELNCSPEALSLSFSDYSPEDFVPSVQNATKNQELMISSRVIF